MGPEGNLLNPSARSCRRIELPSPVLTNEELAKVRHIDMPGFDTQTVSILYPVEQGGAGLDKALSNICEQVDRAIAEGHTFIVLSDRGVDADHAPIPALLATAGVHHHLVRNGSRCR